MSGEGADLESRVGTREADGRHIRSDMQRSERTFEVMRQELIVAMEAGRAEFFAETHGPGVWVAALTS